VPLPDPEPEASPSESAVDQSTPKTVPKPAENAKEKAEPEPVLPRPPLVAAEQRLALAGLLSDRLAAGVAVEVHVDLLWRVAAALPPPNAGTLVAVDPLCHGDYVSTWRVLVTSCDLSDVVLTLQWTGPGSQDQLDTRSLAPGTSEAFSIAGWLGRDADFITVPRIVARAGDARETWDVRLTARKCNPSVVVDVPREVAAPRPVGRDCRIQRAAELLQAERVAEAEAHRKWERQAKHRQQERRQKAQEETDAVAPYRPPGNAASSPKWQIARALTLPELNGYHEVDHPMEYDVRFSEAWAAPTQGGAFAVIYKVSATVHDRYGSDMFPMDATRWVLRPLAVDGSTCTGWKGEPTVLFRTGSEHALPPSLVAIA